MNTLTYIVNCLKDERKVSETLDSILKQREQSFQLKIIISEEDSSIKNLIIEKLSHFKNKYEITEIDPTLNLAEQRNISLNNIETEFFMFIDAGDILPSYTTGFYLEQIKKNDIVFSSVFTKTYNIPQFIDINKLKVNKNVLEDNNITVNRRSTSTNVLFKTSIINNNNIKSINVFPIQ